MIAANVLLFILSAGALAFILRYRIHIHVTYQKPAASRPRRRSTRPPTTAEADPRTAELLAETLVSLGASKPSARAAARCAMDRYGRYTATGEPAPFETLLRAAIKETTAA